MVCVFQGGGYGLDILDVVMQIPHAGDDVSIDHRSMVLTFKESTGGFIFAQIGTTSACNMDTIKPVGGGQYSRTCTHSEDDQTGINGRPDETEGLGIGYDIIIDVCPQITPT